MLKTSKNPSLIHFPEDFFPTQTTDPFPALRCNLQRLGLSKDSVEERVLKDAVQKGPRRSQNFEGFGARR